MFYNYIVKKLVRQGFEHVNNHRFDDSVNSAADNIHHRLAGTHALSGERHNKESFHQWFLRFSQVLPNLNLEINNIWVKGWPWHTTVFVQWDATATLLNGEHSFNHGLHVMTMRWGKVYSIDLFEDSQEVARSLVVQAAAGVAEAVAEPIIS
ncbi:nuclear transport factor 2 family protein [Rugamonas sp. FT82W]|uniref:Nuclear transport factor 2 family protein n=1 Tax=Duganella vulcania TaxID=2692166 RepID=A0A845G784_9BURK|nr:nuclear transport factor 2 family protein [Duganella vulcania]MYM89322.1 nuclear transport factor 2 family protein [Duganella vulcania]